jgi:hypothetical protein
MNLTLKQVTLRGFGGGVYNDPNAEGGQQTMIKPKFAASFNAAVAKRLGIEDDCYREESGVKVLRSFTKHHLPIGFDNAAIEMHRDMNLAPDRIDSADVRKMCVEVDDDGRALLLFSLSMPLNTPEMVGYLCEQRKVEAPQFTIIGKQRSLFDDDDDETDSDSDAD